MVVATGQRLNKMSFQITNEQLAFLQARKTRLGLTSDTEALRDALNALMAIESAERTRTPSVPALGADGPAMGGS